MAGAERILWYLNFAATLGLLLRLVALKLARVYPSLFWYWFAQALEIVLLFVVPLKSLLYERLYYIAQSINLVLAIWVVMALYREALALHPALARFGRKTVVILFGLAAFFASLGVLVDSALPPGRHWLLQRFLATDRTVDLMVLAFLLLMTAILLWFPLRVKRNVVVYILGFVVFYSTRATGLLLVNLLPQGYILPLSAALLASSLACLLGWTLGLRRENEDVVMVTGSPAHGASLDRISLQLDEINTAIARLAGNPSAQ